MSVTIKYRKYRDTQCKDIYKTTTKTSFSYLKGQGAKLHSCKDKGTVNSNSLENYFATFDIMKFQ